MKKLKFSAYLLLHWSGLNANLTYPLGGDRMLNMSGHIQNDNVVKRLKRANGHLVKVIEMLQSDTNCMKVAQQLQAVSSAITSAKKTYVHDHVEHCLTEAIDQKAFKSKINEFKEITKYL